VPPNERRHAQGLPRGHSSRPGMPSPTTPGCGGAFPSVLAVHPCRRGCRRAKCCHSEESAALRRAQEERTGSRRDQANALASRGSRRDYGRSSPSVSECVPTPSRQFRCNRGRYEHRVWVTRHPATRTVDSTIPFQICNHSDGGQVERPGAHRSHPRSGVTCNPKAACELGQFDRRLRCRSLSCSILRLTTRHCPHHAENC
jgi:hypothetical protein